MESASKIASYPTPEGALEVCELRPLPEAPDTLIPATQLPLYIGSAEQTLARWRHEGFGPKYIKVGSRVYYRTDDVRAFLSRQTVDPSAHGLDA